MSSSEPNFPELLRTLAASNVRILTEPQLVDLRDRSWDYGISSGESRYSVLSEMFSMIVEEFDRFGALPTELLNEVVDDIKRQVDLLLTAPNAEGAQAASALYERIASLLTGWDRR